MSLGLGSVVASAVSALPFLKFISEHKAWVFLATGIILGLNYWLVFYLPAKRRCQEGEICHIGSTVSGINRTIFWISVALYVVALGAAYLTLPIVKWFD